MFEFLQGCGVFVWPLLLLAALLVIQTLRVVQRLGTGRADRPAAGLINTVLFWGAVAAVLGVLGQCTGIYHAMQAIRSAKEVSPTVMAAGFAQSFTTTLFGFALLLVAGLAWLLLRTWYGRLESAGAR
jgi:hypothetical protein